MALDLATAVADTPTEAPVGDPGPPPAPGAINLGRAQAVVPKEAPVEAPPIVRAGVALVKWILIMISCFVVLALVWIVISEFRFQYSLNALIQPAPGSPANPASKELLDYLKVARTEFREFWLKIFQMVLLNVLLPVLTALLGYVFGSRHTDSH